jgi:hypothetical protein
MLFPWQLVRATGSGQLWLAGGASPITLQTPTHYGSSYDRGTGFCRYTHQCCKMLVGNKIIGGECVLGQEYVIQLKYALFKAFKVGADF